MLNTDLKRFESLKQRHDSAKTELAKLETLLEEKNKELGRVTADLKALGIDPNNMVEQQKQLEKSLASSLENLEVLLAKVDKLLKGENSNDVGSMDLSA